MAAVAGTVLADCRGDIKMPNFSGLEQDWAQWVVKAEAFFTLLGWDETIFEAEELTDPDMVKNAYITKTHTLEVSKALGIVTLAGRHEGLAAWCALR